MYKVSVLVPVYGVEQYIERCARSLLGQTYPDIEYLFVNDCTSDRSVEVLKQLMDDYPDRKSAVKIINHEKNRGLAASRNTALDNATGEFVCHVDSDDWMELDAIESLVKMQMETASDIVSGNMYIHTISGIEEYHEPHYDDKEQLVLRQMPTNVDHQIFRRIIRRSLYEDGHVRCIEGCNMAEDRYQMIQLCWLADSVSTIDGFVYHYDMNRQGSYTRQSSWEKRLDNMMQELKNWLGIREFLSDKGDVYFNATTPYAVDCIQKTLKLALKHRDKIYFQELADIVRNNEDCMEKMGWKTNALGEILQSYPIMRVKNTANRAFGYACYLLGWKR